MKFYPENFVVRLIICVVGFVLIWLGMDFLLKGLVFHEEFVFSPLRHVILPVVLGVIEAFLWKPKQ